MKKLGAELEDKIPYSLSQSFFSSLEFNLKKRRAKSIERNRKFHDRRITNHYCLFLLYAFEFQKAIRTKIRFSFKF